MKFTGKTTLLTGDVSGIGRALKHRLHDLGNHIVVAGRRLGILTEIAAGRESMSVAIHRGVIGRMRMP